jgi:hypothetical protein
MTVEVVPAFANQDGSFQYPDANGGGRWCTTNPRPEIDAIRARNQDCKGNLIHLCRMMRSWKAQWSVPIGGLLLDTLAYRFMGGYEYREKSYTWYDYICRDFLGSLSDEDEDQALWGALGSGQWVFGGGFQYKAKRCHSLALEAIEDEMAEPKREWSAKQKWRKIFGGAFPS